MALVTRVLDPAPVESLDAYVATGGGTGLEAARSVEPEAVISTISDAGLRGRGGGGFPTGTKWATVLGMSNTAEPTTVVINAAEGEPGTFKDRLLLRRNPYRVLEGALIAAHAVAADRVVVGLKESFATEIARLNRAIDDLRTAGWTDGLDLDVIAGPGHYLLGEETALLEVIAGRAPFPRLAPPFRHGAEELRGDATGPAATTMATEADDTVAPPSLVNNVETFANVPGIVAEGPAWFRSLGTADSPGTVICTVSGRTKVAGVAEVEMGTPLGEVIQQVGDGPARGRVVAVASGTANPLLAGDHLDAPVSYEGLDAAGGGLGSAGFIVIDEAVDVVAFAHGVSRFLSVESCGQCTPCKQDGIAISTVLDRIRSSSSEATDLDRVGTLAGDVIRGARCFLANQHQLVVESLLANFPDALAAHVSGEADAADAYLVAPLADIIDGVAVLDDSQATKQPDWTHDETYSGESPADRIDVGSGDRA
jgi:NADH-quinone oxidoreductase subunit F